MIDLTGKRILVVDDEDYIREHLARHLRKLGCEVIEANNGQDALEKVSNRPNIILMDVKMPVMNGFEATKRLKGSEDTADIPIVILSAKAQGCEMEEGHECGADGYLTKPASFPSILETIQELM